MLAPYSYPVLMWSQLSRHTYAGLTCTWSAPTAKHYVLTGIVAGFGKNLVHPGARDRGGLFMKFENASETPATTKREASGVDGQSPFARPCLLFRRSLY